MCCCCCCWCWWWCCWCWCCWWWGCWWCGCWLCCCWRWWWRWRWRCSSSLSWYRTKLILIVFLTSQFFRIRSPLLKNFKFLTASGPITFSYGNKAKGLIQSSFGKISIKTYHWRRLSGRALWVVLEARSWLQFYSTEDLEARSGDFQLTLRFKARLLIYHPKAQEALNVDRGLWQIA